MLSNEELKRRLEAHNFNCPPITDLTKTVLIRKLAQLDGVEKKNVSKKQTKLMEYSSAEEDTSNTPKLRRKKQLSTATTSTSDNKLPPPKATRNGNGYHSNAKPSAGTIVTTRRFAGNRNGTEPVKKSNLVQYSDQDDDDDDSEESSEEEDDDEEEENESMNGDDDDRTDFGVQTSLDSTLANLTKENATSRLSDNGNHSPTPSPSDLRQRRSRFSSSTPVGPIRSTSAYLSVGHKSPQCSPLAFPPNSPLRRAVAKNRDAFGSLGEALASLPSSSSSAGPTVGGNNTLISETSSAVSQVSRTASDAQMENLRFPSRSRRSSLDYLSVSKIIITFAIAFFGVLVYKYCNLKPRLDIENKLTVCDHQNINDCINSEMVEPFLRIFHKAVANLEDHSAHVKCFTNDTYVGMTLSELEETYREVDVVEQENVIKDSLNYMMNVLKNNPQYGIHVVAAASEDNADDETKNTIRLQYLYPQVGYICWFHITFYAFLAYAKIAMIGSTVLLGLTGIFYLIYKLYKWRCEAILREQQDVFELVEQVLSLLMKHHQHQTLVQDRTRSRNSSITRPGVAVNHIRDQLIPPQDRKRKHKVWNKVISYIRESESRVREDIQVIYGEEHKVWQWIPDVQWSPLSHPGPNPYVAPLHMVQTPLNTTSTTSSLPKMPLQSTPKSIIMSSSTSSTPLASPSSRWQGSATRNIGVPCVAPTSCLKVRHLFDDNMKAKGGANWIRQVIDEVLIRCQHSGANIFHIAVDTQSIEGCVYIKAKNTEDAAKVFKTLHGQWYRGNLVTAKYLRDERYVEKFPDAQYHQTPMQPGNEINLNR